MIALFLATFTSTALYIRDFITFVLSSVQVVRRPCCAIKSPLPPGTRLLNSYSWRTFLAFFAFLAFFVCVCVFFSPAVFFFFVFLSSPFDVMLRLFFLLYRPALTLFLDSDSSLKNCFSLVFSVFLLDIFRVPPFPRIALLFIVFVDYFVRGYPVALRVSANKSIFYFFSRYAISDIFTLLTFLLGFLCTTQLQRVRTNIYVFFFFFSRFLSLKRPT